MSRRHDLDRRLHSLEDIGKIMRSMKNLSYIETRKLARFLDSQQRVVDSIEAAAENFLASYPDLLPAAPGQGILYLLIGAERGFCGNFNEAVRDALGRENTGDAPDATLLIAVGNRLAMLLDGDPRLVAVITGASAAEEVPAVLGRMIQPLQRLTTERGIGTLCVIHWDPDAEQVLCDPLLPPFRALPPDAGAARPFPPRLNLAPEAFRTALIEHALFAGLHALLFGSLMAEHQQRVRHLEGALQRVDSRAEELRQRRNVLRQEEITEEIELILLNLPPPAEGRAGDEAGLDARGGGPGTGTVSS